MLQAGSDGVVHGPGGEEGVRSEETEEQGAGETLTTWPPGPPGPLATWPPGHLATYGHMTNWPPYHMTNWPPSHLATWPPGLLATWPPGHLVVARAGEEGGNMGLHAEEQGGAAQLQKHQRLCCLLFVTFLDSDYVP